MAAIRLKLMNYCTAVIPMVFYHSCSQWLSVIKLIIVLLSFSLSVMTATVVAPSINAAYRLFPISIVWFCLLSFTGISHATFASPYFLQQSDVKLERDSVQLLGGLSFFHFPRATLFLCVSDCSVSNFIMKIHVSLLKPFSLYFL